MNITLNNVSVIINSEIKTIANFIHYKKLSNRKGIAIALNGAVVSKTNWDTQIIEEGDSILIITATQGG